MKFSGREDKKREAEVRKKEYKYKWKGRSGERRKIDKNK